MAQNDVTFRLGLDSSGFQRGIEQAIQQVERLQTAVYRFTGGLGAGVPNLSGTVAQARREAQAGGPGPASIQLAAAIQTLAAQVSTLRLGTAQPGFVYGNGMSPAGTGGGGAYGGLPPGGGGGGGYGPPGGPPGGGAGGYGGGSGPFLVPSGGAAASGIAGSPFGNGAAARMLSRMAVFGALRGMEQSGVAAASAYGSGQPFRIEENLAGPAGALGLGLSMIPGWGPFAGLGVEFAGQAASGFFRGRRELSENQQRTALSLGLSPGDTKALSTYLGKTPDPFDRNIFGDLREIGPAEGLKALQGMAPFLAHGVDLGAATRAAALLTTEHGHAAGPDAAKALAPFINSPFYRDTILSEFRNASGNADAKLFLGGPLGSLLGPRAGQFGSGGLPDSFAVGGVVSHGFSATYDAINALPGLSSERRKQLQAAALRFDDSFQRADLGADVSQSGASIAGSRVGFLRAQGLSADNPEVRSGVQAQIAAERKHIAALEARAATLQEAAKTDKEAERALAGYQAEIAQAKTSLAEFAQQQRVAVQDRQLGRLTSSAGVLALIAERQQYGLTPGSSAPSLAAFITTQKALIGTAERQLQSPNEPEERKEQLRRQIEEARNAILKARREQDFQQVGVPALLAEGFTSRALARIGQQAGFGIGETVLAGALGEGAGGLRRTIGRERGVLSRQEGAPDRYTSEEVDAQRDKIAGLERRLADVQRSQAYLSSDRGIRLSGLASDVAGPAAALTRALGLGPQASVSAGLDVASAYRLQAQAEEGRAKVARSRGEEKIADEADTRAKLFRLQSAGATLDTFSTFSPSAGSRLELGRTELAIRLGENDPFRGGMVPRQLRQREVGLLGQQLGGIDAQIAAAPADQRDAVAAALQGQRSSLILGIQEQRNAMMFGDIGHLINLSFGAPHNLSLFGTSDGLPSAGLYQRFNPGGLPALGGSGANLGMTPLQRRALGPDVPASRPIGAVMGGTGGGSTSLLPGLSNALGAGALGGADGETKDLLRQAVSLLESISRALGRAGGGGGIMPRSASGIPSARADLENDPKALAARGASGF